MTLTHVLKLAALGCAMMPLALQAQPAGEVEYVNACASCHGVEADGNGPLAELMTVEVPGLRDLSAQNGGKFPMLDIIMFIDGRTGIRGHGYPMPVWGSRFKADTEFMGEYGSEMETRGRILVLAQYIESLQELPEDMSGEESDD